MGARGVLTVTLASAEANGLHLQENPNGYENELPSMPRDGQYLEQEYLHEQYADNMEPNDNLMRTNAYRIEVQSAASTDLRLTGPNSKDSLIWAKPDKMIIKIGGVVSVETFLDLGSGISLVGPKLLEKFGATHVSQKDQWMHVGRRMMKVPVYQCIHKPVKVRLVDQREVIISKCLAGVVVESEGQTIKINVWIQEDSPTEDLSLRKLAMRMLGFALRNPAGKNIWQFEDLKLKYPQVTEQVMQFFGRKIDAWSTQKTEPIAQIPLKAADKTTGFMRKVCLQRKLLIYGHQGVTVRVLVGDERIEKEGLYALVAHPLLKNRSDLQVKPVLLKAEVAGRLEVVTDIQNPCLQKYKLRQTEIGTIVRIDELNKDQIDEHFGNYADPELNADLCGT